MAPSPVLNIEPKGPDKSVEKCIESVSTNDKQNKSKTVDDNATSKDKISVDQLSFAEIEEAGLKSLLDEAYSYKSPKDRLGKSDLFQVLLNEVEENDAGKKKLSERSNSFADGRGNASVSIGNGHDTANDKAFLNNILGGCEKDKKKKKNKRESSSANGGSRRPKFSHSMKVNSGPQSSSSSHLYNGNTTNNSNTNSTSNSSITSSNTNTTSSTSSSSSSSSSSSNSNVHYNGGSRSLSRAHQSFATRINNSKTAALLTSSSNIDIPMVTTYNKQPIMTPALVPSSQKSAELLMLDLRDQNCGTKSDSATGSPKFCLANGAEKESDIEMKILETKNTANSISNSSSNSNNNDSVYNYTTHASLEIGAGNTDACKQFNDCDKDGDNAAAVIFPLQSSGSAVAAATLLNGNSERSSMLHGNSQKSMNGLSADEKEDIDNVICNNNNNAENDEDKHSKKKNKKKQAPCLENDNDNINRTSIYATSVDEPKTMTSLLQKSAQNSSTNNSAYKYPTESSYFTPWHVPVPNLIVTLSSESMANLGRNICTKDSLESRRLYDENGVLNSNYPYLSSNSASMNRDRLDNVSERKHKIRKPKKQNTTSVLSENIEGYCGDKSVEYLVEYIENTKPGSGGGGVGSAASATGDPGKTLKSKSTGSASSRNTDRVGKVGGKASTDDDVRKKPTRAKDRLKKSTSLEDLRHSSTKAKQQQQNKKQSSVDDSHYIAKESMDVEPLTVAKREVANSTTQIDYHSPADDAVPSQKEQQQDSHEHEEQEQQYQQLSELDHSRHSYYDNVDHVDDDNYTETEFHLVTKKQRKKKRRSKSRSSTLDHQKHHQLHSHHQNGHSHHNGIHDSATTLSQNFLPHHYSDKNDSGNFAAYQNSKRSTRSTENRHRSRRKSVSSVVPSDKISDSDSIHSLPVSSTTPKCKIKKKSTSSGCTPQASYADIAKSPQCNSSTTLNGGDKWHRSLKTFSSNSPSASCSLSSSSSAYSTQNTCGSGGSVTTASSFGSSSASSSNTGDSPEHSDNSELVCAATSTVAADTLANSDQSCDLNCNSASCGEPLNTAAAIDTVDDSMIDDKDSGCGSVNDSGANEFNVEATLATVTPSKRKNNKSSGGSKSTSDTATGGSSSNTNVAAKLANGIDTTKMPKDYHSNISNNSSSILCNNASNNLNHSIVNNTNNTKVKKTRNKKNKNAGGVGAGGSANADETIASDVNDNHDTTADEVATTVTAKTSATSNDLFIEFTMKCAANATITTTKCSQTQTDLETIEVNNNACSGYHHHHHQLQHHHNNPSNSNGCNDVSVEETMLDCSSKSQPDTVTSCDGVDKLSHSLPIHNSETGQSVGQFGDVNCPDNVAQDEVDDELPEGDTTVETLKQRQVEIQKEIIERSSKYNVTEVIQYVNKSWNEVMNLASSKVTNTNNKKVQYYASK